MKRTILLAAGVLALAGQNVCAGPGSPPPPPARTTRRSPRLRPTCATAQWSSSGRPTARYDTLRPGTNRLMCYDQSGDAGEQPISSQCTSVGNLERVKQNKIYEAKIADRTAREAALTELEKAGTRVKPEFGSVFYTRQGKDATTTACT